MPHSFLRCSSALFLATFLGFGCVASGLVESDGTGGYEVVPGAGGTLGGAGGKGGTAGVQTGSGGKGGTAGVQTGSGGKGGAVSYSGSLGGYSAYTANAPSTSDTIKNACDTDGGSISYICPRFMLFSPEMNQAAKDDGWPYNYGVATLNNQPCCSCWQLVFDKPTNGNLSYSPPPPLVIQMFNTGGADRAFDIFLGKGGMGAFPKGCPKLYSAWPSTGENFNGGIRASSLSECGKTDATLSSSACVSAVSSACNGISAGAAYVTNVTRNSCVVANRAGELYHENWNVKARRVECPASLTKVTGCKPNAGGFPAPDANVRTAAQASGWDSYTTTTMQDCCKPSCSWKNNVSGTQSPWTVMYQCNASGTPM